MSCTPIVAIMQTSVVFVLLAVFADAAILRRQPDATFVAVTDMSPSDTSDHPKTGLQRAVEEAFSTRASTEDGKETLAQQVDTPIPPSEVSSAPPQNKSVVVPCQMFGGLLSTSVSPQCCFSVNVVSQRGLAAFGLAKPCEATWDCKEGTATPTAMFERSAVQKMCAEENCVEQTMVAMQSNWMTAKAAAKLGGICKKNRGGAASRPYPSGPALNAMLHETPGDTSEFDLQCNETKCSNEATINSFCGFDGSTTDVKHECYGYCCTSRRSTDGALACFPGQAQVQTRDGLLDMSDLSIGHEILVESSEGLFEYAPVLSFLHTIPAHKAGKYVVLTHEYGTLRASENHVIFLCDGEARTERRAGEISAGEHLCAASSGITQTLASRVIKVEERAGARGMFAPLTASGTIVVDGAVASNYATPNNLPIKHSVMHATLFPLRVYYALGLDTKLAPIWSALCGLSGWNTACSQETFELHPYVSLFHETAHLEKLATLL